MHKHMQTIQYCSNVSPVQQMCTLIRASRRPKHHDVSSSCVFAIRLSLLRHIGITSHLLRIYSLSPVQSMVRSAGISKYESNAWIGANGEHS